MKSLNFVLAFILAFLPTLTAVAQVTSVTEQVLDKNYVTNGGFENSTAGYKAYKNTAQTLPTTGTGGTPSVTITSSTSAPISGKASGILTKGASNLQGEGISIPFTVDSAAKGRVLTISAFYQIISGTYSGGSSSTDSDVEVYVYDVDAAQIVMPAGYKLDGGVSGFNYPIAATFQTNTTSTNYRLLFHVATTSASAYQLKLDQIKVGIQNRSQGPPVTDWTAFTPTGTWTTNTTYTGFMRRVGGEAEFDVQVATSGAPNNVQLLLNIPNGLSIDSTKTTAAIDQKGAFGTVKIEQANYYQAGVVSYATSKSVYLYSTNAPTGNTEGPINATTPETWAAGHTIHAMFKVPIQGWASTVTMSDSADTRVVGGMASGNTSLGGTATPVQLTIGSVALDTHGSFANNAYTVKVPGIYKLLAKQNLAATPVAQQYLGIYKNGTILPSGSSQVSTAGNGLDQTVELIVQLAAGDVITIYGWENSGSAFTNSASLIVTKVSGPSQIAASETVAASYTNTSGQSLPNATATVVTGWTKDFDTHSFFNTSTNVATIPIAGTYRITFSRAFSAAFTGATQAYIFKAGSTIAQSYQDSPQAYVTAAVVKTLKLVAGDQISFAASQSSGSAKNLNADASECFFSIERIGN